MKTPQPQIFYPKRNPMFTEFQTMITVFLRYPTAVPCAHCGRKSKHHWSQRVYFRASSTMEDKAPAFTIQGGALLPGGSPVCRSHVLMPEVWAPDQQRSAKGRKKK